MLNKLVPLMVRRLTEVPMVQAHHERFDGLTTSGINTLPFVLSLSKDLFRAYLTLLTVKSSVALRSCP